MADREHYNTIEEVADRLQVSDQTIRRWIKSGRLPAYKPGREWRIRTEDLEAFLEARSSPKATAPPSPRPPEEASEGRREQSVVEEASAPDPRKDPKGWLLEMVRRGTIRPQEGRGGAVFYTSLENGDERWLRSLAESLWPEVAKLEKGDAIVVGTRIETADAREPSIVAWFPRFLGRFKPRPRGAE